MRKLLKIGLPAVALLLLVPGIIGALTYQRLVGEADRLAAAYERVGTETSREIERGWFSTRYDARIALDDPQLVGLITRLSGHDGPGDTPLLDIKAIIRHGLLPLVSLRQAPWRPSFGDALVTFHVSLDGQRYVVPVNVVARAGLLAKLKTRIYLANASGVWHGGPTVEWTSAGGIFDFGLPLSAGQANGAGQLGDINLSGPQFGTLDLRGTQLSAEARHAGAGQVDWHELAAEIEQVDFSSLTEEVANLGAQNLTLRVARNYQDERIAASLSLGMTDAFYASTESDGIRLALGGDFDAALAHEAIGQILARDANPIEVQNELLRIATAMTAVGLSIDLNELYLGTSDGAVRAQINAALPAGRTDPVSIMRRGSGTAHVEIPVKLAKLVAGMMPDGDSSLRTALAAGFIVVQDNYYVADLVFEKGRLTVNGFPMPLPY